MAAAAEAAGDSSVPVQGAELRDRWNIHFIPVPPPLVVGIRYDQRPLRVLVGVHPAPPQGMQWTVALRLAQATIQRPPSEPSG